MPILAEETSLFPETLLDDPPDEDGRSWWAVYARSRQEKALARHLLAREIPFYLPLVAKRQCIRGRQACSHLPLFAGYLFLHATEDERVGAMTTNRILQILTVDNQDQLLGDLRKIRDLIESRAPLTVESRLTPGCPVRVRVGSLQGLEGIIVRRNGKSRLLVAVKYLQQGVSVEIEDCMVEPL
jgi:hypothetical protein